MAVTIKELMGQLPKAAQAWTQLQARWGQVQARLSGLSADIAVLRAGEQTEEAAAKQAELSQEHRELSAVAAAAQERIAPLQARYTTWRDNHLAATVDAFWRDGQKIIADLEKETITDG